MASGHAPLQPGQLGASGQAQVLAAEAGLLQDRPRRRVEHGFAVDALDGQLAAGQTVGEPGQTVGSRGGDLVARESQESFPASDPPSWTPEKVG